MVTPCNDEQQRQALAQLRNRGRRGLTRWVRLIEGEIPSKQGASTILRSIIGETRL